MFAQSGAAGLSRARSVKPLNEGEAPWETLTSYARRLASVLCFVFILAGYSPARAQQGALNSAASTYIDYPQPQAKVQPFDLRAVPKWATLDIELRGRLEFQSSDNYVAGNQAVYVLTRVWGGLEVRPATWMTAYLQFMDLHALGLPLKYVAPNQRDTFDARQAFLDLHGRNLHLIAGRQELRYGGERLVGISDWTNISRTWDGFLGRIGDKNRLDVFTSSVVMVYPTSLDKHGAGLTFHGAVATIGTWVPHTVVQPFIYVKALQRVQGRQEAFGTETAVTPGAEVSSNLPNGIYYDVLGALQRGSYANDSLRSAAGYVKAGYIFNRARWKPRPAAEYDYASGNPNGDAGRFGTFDQQYPSNHNAFGLTDLFGFQNIKQERINLDLAPSRHVTALIQQEWLQTASRFDSIYNGAAAVVVKVPAGGLSSGDIGREFDASGRWVIEDYLVLNTGIGHLSPGNALKANAHGPPLTLAYFGLTYQFELNRENGSP